MIDSALREHEISSHVFETIINTRAQAVTAMSYLAVNGKEGSDSWLIARELESDMQRMMHNRFEV